MNEIDNPNVSEQEVSPADAALKQESAAAPSAESAPESSEAPAPAPESAEAPAQEAAEAPTPEAAPSPAPEKAKKGSSKTLILVLALLVICAGAFFGIRAISGGKPIDKAFLGIQKSMEAMEKSNYLSMMKNINEGGSVNVNIDLADLLGSLIGEEVPLQLSMTSYNDVKSKQAAFALDALFNDKSILNGTILGSDKGLTVACEAILGKTAYSLDLKNVSKNLPGSFLDPNTDSDLALPEELYNWLIGLKDGPAVPAEEVVEKRAYITESAEEVLYDSLDKNAEISKANETVSIGETEVKTTAVTLKLDGKQAAAILTDLINWAKSDENLKSLFTDTVNTFAPLFDAGSDDAEELVSSFYEALDQALEEISGIEKEDLDLTCVFYVNRSGGQLVKAEITSKAGSDQAVLCFEGGPDWKEPAYFAFRAEDPSGKQSMTYTVEEDTKDLFSARLEVKEDSDTAVIRMSQDRSSGDFTVSSDELGVKMTGTVTRNGDVTTVELKKLEYSYVTINDMGITFTFKENDKMPTFSDTTEILSLSKGDLDAMAEDILEALNDLGNVIEDAMD